MSRNDNALAHNPNDAERLKQDKKRKLIIFSTVIFVVCAALLFFYARSASEMANSLNQKTPVKSNVSPASKPASSTDGSGDDYMGSNTPAKLVIEKHEDAQKESAKAKGHSFIDSTNALKEKASKSTPPVPKKPKETKKEVVKKETPPSSKKEVKKEPPVKSDAQIRRENMARLLGVDSYYPSSDGLKKAAKKSIQTLHDQTEKLDHQEYKTVVSLKPSNDTKNSNSSNNPKKGKDGSNASGKDKKEKVDMTTMYASGGMVMCALKFEVKSDYKLPVFCDVIEPPLEVARIIGSFEMTERQDGVILRGNRMEIGDEAIKISAYAIDITTDLSPLFDNNYDSHFMERFLARASAAFAVPFIDFVANTSSAITDGTVIVDSPAVDSTKDRIIGGMASVAKEFIPDLRANSNIPPTITIPNDYIVGMVMTQPLRVPTKLVTGVRTDKPARPTTTFGKN